MNQSSLFALRASPDMSLFKLRPTRKILFIIAIGFCMLGNQSARAMDLHLARYIDVTNDQLIVRDFFEKIKNNSNDIEKECYALDKKFGLHDSDVDERIKDRYKKCWIAIIEYLFRNNRADDTKTLTAFKTLLNYKKNSIDNSHEFVFRLSATKDIISNCYTKNKSLSLFVAQLFGKSIDFNFFLFYVDNINSYISDSHLGYIVKEIISCKNSFQESLEYLTHIIYLCLKRSIDINTLTSDDQAIQNLFRTPKRAKKVGAVFNKALAAAKKKLALEKMGLLFAIHLRRKDFHDIKFKFN